MEWGSWNVLSDTPLRLLWKIIILIMFCFLRGLARLYIDKNSFCCVYWLDSLLWRKRTEVGCSLAWMKGHINSSVLYLIFDLCLMHSLPRDRLSTWHSFLQHRVRIRVWKTAQRAGKPLLVGELAACREQLYKVEVPLSVEILELQQLADCVFTSRGKFKFGIKTIGNSKIPWQRPLFVWDLSGYTWLEGLSFEFIFDRVSGLSELHSASEVFVKGLQLRVGSIKVPRCWEIQLLNS